MPRYDLVLVHAPSVFDFRKKPAVHGPISDVIPPSPYFEMYPIGLISISEHLTRAGFEVRIVNLAMKMLDDPNFDPEKFLKSLDTRMFGVTLHWLPHVNGALAVSELLKKLHPKTPVMMGGFSASFFHEELIREYPAVDFVMRGDSTEKPMVDFMEAVACGREDFSSIDNLTWRGKGGEVIVNPLNYRPSDLSEVFTNYEHAIRQSIRHLDITGYQPFQTWKKYPITAVFTCRGCIHNCKTCGGGTHYFSETMKRPTPAFKPPKLVARDMKVAENFINAPIFIIGDVMQLGEEYALELFAEIKRLKIRNEVAIEFFAPVPRKIVAAMADAMPKFNIEISPESHDEEVRYAFGRPFDNKSLEQFIADAEEFGCRRFDIFFMTGLPKQTRQNVLDTVDYCEMLMQRFGSRRMLRPFISPLAPFVDPGSAVWQHPDRYGYKLFYTKLSELRAALDMPSWKYFLNYETQWMTRDEIVYTTYEAGMKLNDVKARLGYLSEGDAKIVRERNQRAVALMHEIDEALAIPDPAERERAMALVRPRIRDVDESTLCDKKELDWPTGLLLLQYHKVAPVVISAFLNRIFNPPHAKKMDRECWKSQ
jgi:B12-binding domain/radical SAM domain protein